MLWFRMGYWHTLSFGLVQNRNGQRTIWHQRIPPPFRRIEACDLSRGSVKLPNKRPFIFSMIGGAVSGIYLMVSGATGYTMGGLGIFGVVNYITGSDASGMYHAFIGIAIASVIGFLLTFFFWKEDMVEEVTEKRNIDLSRKRRSSSTF
ncbi:hypothetical protein UAO_02628 [Enterococcus villorum ATCC 700913]|uniref:PTS system, Fru family, IIC component n=1 Tax=Enterococcus villorum ATCC 700913 TaxID=1158604 RepID=A0ABN0KDJ5_9ENTE|nr:hypothetical protein UAO_02628 [Enterococcus villorum ATCC 700913]EOW78683.1 hypothetical protein I591_00226 [Enterococcus villorum ATCC 700913]